MTEIATKIFQAGGSRESLLWRGSEANQAAVRDVFEWEAFFRKHGLYVTEMWTERWDGTDLWRAIAGDRVYLCFLHQLDFRRLLDQEDEILTEEQRSDIRVAPMPTGVSLELSEDHVPLRTGGPVSQISGWWWGIPEAVANKKRSWKVAQVITGKDFQQAEVDRFGILPVRVDVFGRETASNGAMLRKVWERSWSQMGFTAGPYGPEWRNRHLASWIPHHRQWPTVQGLWLDAWDRVVFEGKDLDSVLCTLCRDIRGIVRDEQPCPC